MHVSFVSWMGLASRYTALGMVDSGLAFRRQFTACLPLNLSRALGMMMGGKEMVREKSSTCF